MKNKKFNYLAYRVVVLGFIWAILTVSLLILTALKLLIYDYLIILIFLGVYLSIMYTGYRWIYLPYKETKKILQLFASGYTMQGVFDIRYHLTPEMESSINKLKELFNSKELISSSKKQAQYLALQNQINPHFLYNTLEGIRSEALVAKLYTVAEMTEALATFFRYTISNLENLVSLEDELINVENYYLIQQYRFGERINLNIEYCCENKDEVLKCSLPKLTLQPIVENAIFHGIERKIGKGNINIKIEATKKRLIITVSDDGIGMGKEQINELIAKLNIQSLEYVNHTSEKMGGIAIVNVNNRIKLIFGEEYGINIYSTKDIGTDVEITMPLASI